MGKIRFSIPGYNLSYPYPVCNKGSYKDAFIMHIPEDFIEWFLELNLEC